MATKRPEFEGEFMMTHTVHIDGKRSALMSSNDLDDLKREIVDAVRSGGGFVSIRSSENETIEVLVTAHTSLAIANVYVGEAETSMDARVLVSDDDPAGEPLLDYEVYGLDLLSA